jgi:hypothetical protein
MGKKWTKAQHENFHATWVKKRKVMQEKLTWVPNGLPKDAFSIIEKWNKEADEIFVALPFEKKADLLGKL